MKRYEKKNTKKSLTTNQINLILTKIIFDKNVANYIIDCGIPVNAYYRAINGNDVKVEYIDKMLSTIKKY